EAETTFSALANGTTALKTAGQFYLGLTYLRQDDLARTREAMEGIPATHPDFGPKARAILDAIQDD
ncbi:MAG: hypothetical protein AAF597_09285, partial [Bacteroidota bacterium]